MANYDIFKGEDLQIADRIQKLRLCLLVHSCIYYHLDKNIISDKQWDEWARELVNVQKQNPEISEKVCWYEAFKDWDASTGAFLPITDEWVVMKAQQLLSNNANLKMGGKLSVTNNRALKKKVPPKSAKKALF